MKWNNENTLHQVHFSIVTVKIFYTCEIGSALCLCMQSGKKLKGPWQRTGIVLVYHRISLQIKRRIFQHDESNIFLWQIKFTEDGKFN